MIYVAITARSDVAYAVGKTSRGMHQPNKLHHCDMLIGAVGFLQKHNIPSTPLYSQAIENLFPVRIIKLRRCGSIEVPQSQFR